MKKVAILQSNYIPWKGYFDLINTVDEFIVYDEVQYTKRDWRNRNKIKGPEGLQWLSVPVEVKGKFHQKICDVRITDKAIFKKHWMTINQFYRKAEFYKDYSDVFEEYYLGSTSDYISEINISLIRRINNILGIETKISSSRDYIFSGGKTEKIIEICKQSGADIYLSGPAAKGYFDTDMAEKEGIKVEWFDYSGYPEYRQLYGRFVHGVTILDLIFNEGPNAVCYMKSFQNGH
ncbi:WbqC family protein [Marinobacterium maritimum]|uniref:WbqC family protein n=1 Tax=Marinobacterium maritimum TaxID=500162 RepID=A0ABN1I4W7_9GAMM